VQYTQEGRKKEKIRAFDSHVITDRGLAPIPSEKGSYKEYAFPLNLSRRIPPFVEAVSLRSNGSRFITNKGRFHEDGP
jgi:hypothetical protein